MSLLSATDADLAEGGKCSIPLTPDHHECANCGMTFDMKMKLFDHMIIHDPNDTYESDENNSSISKECENDEHANRRGPMQTGGRV